MAAREHMAVADHPERQRVWFVVSGEMHGQSLHNVPKKDPAGMPVGRQMLDR
jgi:hypothetical protein